MNVKITPRQAKAVSKERLDVIALRTNMIVEIQRVIVVDKPILPAVIIMAIHVPTLALVIRLNWL
jgi:hypothetical protein